MKNKSNMFLDKRIGEKDNNLSAEDKMIARYSQSVLRIHLNLMWIRILDPHWDKMDLVPSNAMYIEHVFKIY